MSVKALERSTITYKILEKIPNKQVSEGAKKVAAYIQNGSKFISNAAIFYSMFYVTHSFALQAGFLTVIGVIGLYLSAKCLPAKYLPESIKGYVEPITNMQDADKGMLIAAGAVTALVTGGALFFQIPVSIVLANMICVSGAKIISQYFPSQTVSTPIEN